MKGNVILLILMVLFVNISCNNSTNNKLSEEEILRNEITEREKHLRKIEYADNSLALEMVDKYVEFADRYPEDTLTGEYLFKAAEISMNFNHPKDAVTYLSRIESNYPDFDKYATALFLQGFIYENLLNNSGMAKIYYDKLIEEFPDHKLTADAKNALMFLDMNEEELIKIFEQMN